MYYNSKWTTQTGIYLPFDVLPFIIPGTTVIRRILGTDSYEGFGFFSQ